MTAPATADSAATRHGRHEASPVGSAWTGTARLIRHALQRDRIRLSVWIAVLTLTMVYSPNAIELAYPDEAARLARVNLLKTPAGIMLGGPMMMIRPELVATMGADMMSADAATAPHLARDLIERMNRRN